MQRRRSLKWNFLKAKLQIQISTSTFKSKAKSSELPSRETLSTFLYPWTPARGPSKKEGKSLPAIIQASWGNEELCQNNWWIMNWRTGLWSACRPYARKWLREKLTATSLKKSKALRVGRNSEWSTSYAYWKCLCRTKNCWCWCTKRYFPLDSMSLRTILLSRRRSVLRVARSLKAWTSSLEISSCRPT